MKTQSERILKALKCGRKLTKLDMLNEFDCMNSGARINELRNGGYSIVTNMIEVASGKHVAEYQLRR